MSAGCCVTANKFTALQVAVCCVGNLLFGTTLPCAVPYLQVPYIGCVALEQNGVLT